MQWLKMGVKLIVMTRLAFEPINKSGDEADLSNRSLIRIHGGRQEGVPKPKLLRTSGCIRVLDSDAKILYDYP